MKIISTAFSLLVIGGIVAVGAGAYGKSQFEASGPSTEPTEVLLKRGSGLNAIAGTLAKEGVISDALIFRLGAKLKGADRALKAGEYAIPAGASMQAVLDQLTKGDTIQRKVTAAEGLTSFEIVQRVNAAEKMTGEITEIPPEGSLAPETYFYQRDENRAALIARMSAAQTAILDELWEKRAPDLPLKTKEEALILASIVEKETGVSSERARVAAVFINRLNRGMRLQTDPTVIYGITLGKSTLGRGIRRSELKAETPYNTYVIKGLPPTPIANPGRAAIEATLNPIASKELYFVADGTGGHAFAETLKQHNRNVAEWRKIEKQRKASE
jgi:UPF0755 protein